MSYRLGSGSLARLEGVDPDLVRVVQAAIGRTAQDFVVFEGLRTIERQRELVASGASQTMASNHLTGRAVDLVPYIGGRAVWDMAACQAIAEAMRSAAIELGVPLTWGCSWHVDLRLTTGSGREVAEAYAAHRRSAGKKPFLDGPHYELR